MFGAKESKEFDKNLNYTATGNRVPFAILNECDPEKEGADILGYKNRSSIGRLL